MDRIINRAREAAARLRQGLSSRRLAAVAGAGERGTHNLAILPENHPFWKAAGHVLCLCLPLLQLLTMDYYNYSADGERFRAHFSLHPHSFRFEITVMYLLYFTVVFLLRRPYLTSVLMTLLALLGSYAHYMKLTLNGDPLMPGDLSLLSRTGELLSFTKGAGLPPHFLTFLGGAILLLTLLFPFRQLLRIRSRWPMAISALIVAFALSCVFSTARSERVLKNYQMDFFNAALQSSNYSANGFVGAFSLNVLSLHIQAPKGYSEQTIEAILAPYEDAAEAGGVNAPAAGTADAGPAAPPTAQAAGKTGAASSPTARAAAPLAGESPDVILVLSESFFDIRTVQPLRFSQNPLPHFDAVTADPNCISGSLYVSAFAGGTVRPEFEVLTGLPLDGLPASILPYAYVGEDMETYVSRYKEAGYHTLSLHTYDARFYGRQGAYKYLGFDDFYGDLALSHSFKDIAYSPQMRISDPTLAKMIEHYVDESEAPCFLYAITMENHQPYLAIEDESRIAVKVTCDSPALGEEDLVKVTTYTNNLYDADRMLGELKRYVDRRKRPTVLVFFGDHKPNLGNTFTALGTYDKDGESMADWKGMYSTPFLIYANRTLQDEDCMLQKGSDNALSTYHLMNAVAQATGMQPSPYMELLEDFYDAAPYYNSRLHMTLEGEAAETLRKLQLVTYDRLLGKGYSMPAEQKH